MRMRCADVVSRSVAVCALVAACCAILALQASAAAAARWLPPSNPPSSLALDEHLDPQCKGVQDHSQICLDESVAMLNAGRRHEHLGPLMLPRNWSRLSVPDQIFVLTELERTARGLPPDTGLAADWNAAAREGANAGEDPDRGGSGAAGFESIWAGGQPNPIVATVGWIYDDGLFPDGTSQNGDCQSASDPGCWGHRDAILHDSAATACGSSCAVGAAYSPVGFRVTGPGGHESYAEVFSVEGANNPDRLIFRWANELPQLPACERRGDTCPWKGQPLVTAKGYQNVRGLAPGNASVRPGFTYNVGVSWNTVGDVELSIGVGIDLTGLDVSASDGARKVRLVVKRASARSFTASGRLGSGNWTITILYLTPPSYGPRPSSTAHLNIP